jgi:hypothetical protein
METGSLQRVVEVGVLQAARHGDGAQRRAAARPFPAARHGDGKPCSAWWRWASSRQRAMETGSPAARGGEALPDGARWRQPLQLHVVAPPLQICVELISTSDRYLTKR